MRAPPASVLFVTQYYRPEPIGSAPFCGDIAEWLVRQGRQVMVLSGLPQYPSAGLFPAYRNGGVRSEMIGGVAVERLRSRMPESRSSLARLSNEGLFLVRGILALATGRIAQHRVVLSLCPSILSVALGVLARRRHGRHVAIVHDIQSGLAGGLGMVGNARLIRLMRWCEKKVLNRIDLIIVPNAAMGEQLRRIGVTAAIEVVPIWVDTESIRPVSGTLGGAIRLLYSGNLGRKQGLDQIVALAEELKVRRPTIEIVVRGGGSQARRLGAEIAARRIGNIRLADLVPRERLSEGLCEGHIHLVPQDPDAANFAVPSKIYAIMAAARPFVATASPASPLWRLMEESRAFLCAPPDDPAAFAATVLRLADDERLRHELGANGRRYVEANCTKSRILARLATLIDGLGADA